MNGESGSLDVGVEMELESSRTPLEARIEVQVQVVVSGAAAHKETSMKTGARANKATRGADGEIKGLS